jgi:UDP-N-acetylglucosamine--N-acetylmuramyl-(pentapeptide) pyrophosphoryl-undecaprenol N-acetylglucosamine transferase
MAVIVLAGGGTGGHVYPALAIGDELRRRGHTVLYYGDPHRLEARVAPDRGYAFRPVRAAQYPRGGIVGKIQFAWSLLKATWAVRASLRQDRADVVLGVGGYIAAPTVLAAWTLGLGRAVHEANVVPGLANQLCARVAQAVLLTFEATRARMPGRARKLLVGVPVSPKVTTGTRAEGAARYGMDPSLPIALFVGGSLGAARINELALAVARLPGRAFQVIHLCGPRYEAEVRAHLGEATPERYALVPYEDRMELAYAAADLVVCRSGSSTLAELAAVGKASVLVPSPNVTENHQEENARGFEGVGAADVVVEQGWDLDAAVARVAARMADAARLAEMGRAALTLARPDADNAAADVVEGLAPGR